MNLEDFLAKLDPKTAKRVKTAQEVELRKFPLASLGLTHALGGGVAAGRITTVYGNTSSGKSMLLMQTIGMLQKAGYVCGYGDAEGTYDKAFAARLGVDNSQLMLTQKKSFGGMTDEIIPWIEAELDFLVIDSISDLLPDVFLDSDGHVKEFDGMKQIGAHAKSNTMMMNAIHYANQKTAVILISQTTTKIENTYVKQVPHGGKKLEFGSSQIIKLTSSATDAQQHKGNVHVGDRVVEQPIGRKVEAVVEKNKLGPQSRKASYDIYYAGDFIGIDTVGEIVDLSTDFGILEKKGSWFYHGDRSWQGRPNLIKEVRKDEDLQELLRKEVNTFLTGEV